MLLNGPLNTGLPTLDEFLTLRFLQLSSPERQTGMAGAMYFILGTTVRLQEQVPDTTTQVAAPAQGQQLRGPQQQQLRQQQRRQIAAQIEQEKRRSFLRGSLAGGASILGLGALIYIFRALVNGYADSGVQAPSQGSNNNQSATSTPDSNASGNNGANSTPTPGSTPSAASAGAIAQVKAVPSNSSTTFTIPSSSDPGILVHLSSGQFVAYDATCTHAGCPVDYDPSQQLLVCPCHGAAFDPTKAAAVVQGPAPTPLAPVSIHVDSATGTITLA
jgi:thiosulfate dehydrogenase (quinone) large subunit